jgi:hypothetical protein
VGSDEILRGSQVEGHLRRAGDVNPLMTGIAETHVPVRLIFAHSRRSRSNARRRFSYHFLQETHIHADRRGLPALSENSARR